MGTDTAFALGVLALVGRRCPPRLRVFLLTLVIVDDIAALTIIALVYTDECLGYGAAARRRVLRPRPGDAAAQASATGSPTSSSAVALWIAMLESGVHPTIAGVALGVLATAYPPTRADLQDASTQWRLFREQPTPEYARSANRERALGGVTQRADTACCSTRGRAT